MNYLVDLWHTATSTDLLKMLSDHWLTGGILAGSIAWIVLFEILGLFRGNLIAELFGMFGWLGRQPAVFAYSRHPPGVSLNENVTNRLKLRQLSGLQWFAVCQFAISFAPFVLSRTRGSTAPDLPIWVGYTSASCGTGLLALATIFLVRDIMSIRKLASTWDLSIRKPERYQGWATVESLARILMVAALLAVEYSLVLWPILVERIDSLKLAQWLNVALLCGCGAALALYAAKLTFQTMQFWWGDPIMSAGGHRWGEGWKNLSTGNNEEYNEAWMKPGWGVARTAFACTIGIIARYYFFLSWWITPLLFGWWIDQRLAHATILCGMVFGTTMYGICFAVVDTNVSRSWIDLHFHRSMSKIAAGLAQHLFASILAGAVTAFLFLYDGGIGRWIYRWIFPSA